MSAAALTKKFLATDFLTEEENFFECLCAVLEEFIATKNPIFPRQDIIVQLMKVLTGSSNIQLIKLVLTTLIEFSDSSTTYSAEFVKRLLISHKIVRILCLVLSSNRLYKDKMLSELSLSLLRRLSDILLPVEMSIVLTDILPLCVSLCNVKKQILFAFRPAIKQKLTELVINKSVVMQEQLYETGVTQEKCDLMLSLFGCKHVQMSHCVGDLFDTSSNADRNIGDEIVEQGLAWSCPTDEVDSGTAVWRDVIPGEVVHGPHFLGHELDKIGQIADIEEILSDTQHIPLASEPSPAEFVTVRGPIISPHRKMKDPTNAYYRAQVCHKNEKGSYLAISLDYGQVREVTQSQLYQPCSGLLHILPSATLFSLRGLKPSPFSLNMLSTALSILQILTVGNFTICESMVNQWSALGVLTELASISPVESISSKSMTVLMHISKCSRVRCDEIVKRGTVSKTLELLKRFVGLNWRDAVLSTATALCSMLVDNSAASAQFECGVGALLAAISAYQSDEKVYSTLILCLRNHLGPIDVSLMIPKQTHVELQTSMPSDTSQLSSSVREPVVAISSPPSSLSTVEVKAISRFSRENEREVNASRHRQLDLNTLEQQESDNSSEKIVQPQLSLSNPACHREFYSLDEKTELRTGPNCSVYDSKASLDCLNVQKHIAGFLNAGVSGRLIFGVSSSGNAHGININRDTRDQLRLGMDRVCMELSPPLTANVPTLYFTPICCPEGAMDASLRTFIPDRFVVEIVVNASPAISQAYRVKPDDRLFLRMGSENKEANVQDFREMITRRLEEAVEAVV